MLLRGMMTTASKLPQHITTQVTEELFGLSDIGYIACSRVSVLGVVGAGVIRGLVECCSVV